MIGKHDKDLNQSQNSPKKQQKQKQSKQNVVKV